ncbi:hypothetical protein [Pseudomonas sp. F(2018)]|uniref:hypothetical protein n=1 Tax=Pseudomonas sp. F(2018) TaxID=2502240 RepID=UPI0010F44BCE|nr:hypothetical protein [Pseudomonas sp. F(2018)]
MRLPHIVLRLGPLLLLIGLTLFATSPASHSPAGVLQLFLFSLFISLGFLLCGGRRFGGDGETGSSA